MAIERFMIHFVLKDNKKYQILAAVYIFNFIKLIQVFITISNKTESLHNHSYFILGSKARKLHITFNTSINMR